MTRLEFEWTQINYPPNDSTGGFIGDNIVKICKKIVRDDYINPGDLRKEIWRGLYGYPPIAKSRLRIELKYWKIWIKINRNLENFFTIIIHNGEENKDYENAKYQKWIYIIPTYYDNGDIEFTSVSENDYNTQYHKLLAEMNPEDEKYVEYNKALDRCRQFINESIEYIKEAISKESFDEYINAMDDFFDKYKDIFIKEDNEIINDSSLSQFTIDKFINQFTYNEDILDKFINISNYKVSNENKFKKHFLHTLAKSYQMDACFYLRKYLLKIYQEQGEHSLINNINMNDVNIDFSKYHYGYRSLSSIMFDTVSYANIIKEGFIEINNYKQLELYIKIFIKVHMSFKQLFDNACQNYSIYKKLCEHFGINTNNLLKYILESKVDINLDVFNDIPDKEKPIYLKRLSSETCSHQIYVYMVRTVFDSQNWTKIEYVDNILLEKLDKIINRYNEKAKLTMIKSIDADNSGKYSYTISILSYDSESTTKFRTSRIVKLFNDDINDEKLYIEEDYNTLIKKLKHDKVDIEDM